MVVIVRFPFSAVSFRDLPKWYFSRGYRAERDVRDFNVREVLQKRQYQASFENMPEQNLDI